MKSNCLFLLLLLFFFLPATSVGQQAVHLNEAINTQYEEREPMLSPDGKTLYVWRRRHPGNFGGAIDQGDTWAATRLGDYQYGPTRHLPRPINSAGLDFLWQVSATGDTLYFSQIRTNQDQGMYYTYPLPSGQWATPRPLSIQGFVPRGKHRDYLITQGGQMLIPNEGRDGYGGPDLYVCFPLNDSTWGPPQNLGPTINSSGDEDAPFLLPDGKTLFFASNGRESGGDQQIYYSTRLDDSWKNWSEPEPVGAPINSPGNETDFILTDDGTLAFWISDYQSRGAFDIHEMRMKDCVLDVYPQGDQVRCEGDSVTLEGGFTLGTKISYQWFKDGKKIPGATQRRLTVRSTGSYKLKRKRDGCVRSSEPQQLTFIPSPQVKIVAEKNFICEEDSIVLKAVSEDAASWTWVKNGLKIPGANRPDFWVKRPGTYWVQVSNGTCGSDARAIHIGRMERPLIYPKDIANQRLRPRANEWLWTREFSEKREKLLIQDMSSDPQGNSAVIGLQGEGRGHREVIRYFDREGNLKWQAKGPQVNDPRRRFIQLDYEGNVLVLNAESYLRKYDPSGRLLWEKKQAIGPARGLASDPLGQVYVMVRYDDAFQLEGQAMPGRPRGGGFIAKYDPWGQLSWTRTFTASPYPYDFGNGLQCDQNGNLYAAGGFDMLAVFDGEEILRGALRSSNFFLARYFPDGKLHWARRFSTASASRATSDLFTDASGNSYLLHNYQLLRYDAYGRITWRANASALGGADVRAARIAVDQQGTLFTLGITDKNTYFLSRTDRSGRDLQIWSQKANSRETAFLPAITANAEGKLLLACQSDGKAPSRAAVDELPAFLTAYGPPDPDDQLAPLAICPGEEIEMVVKIPSGLPFYWLKDGKPIPGANDTLFTLTEKGLYQVRAFSGSCESYSNSQQVDDCYQALANPPQKQVQPEEPKVAQQPPKPPQPPTPPAVQPKPEPVPEPEPEPEADIKTSFRGTPTSINDRRVRRQGGVEISSPKVTLRLWDRGAVDNDTISLNVNGKWLVEKYRLNKTPRVFEVEFEPGANNYIILFAHNLGAIPPNTATLSIDDGKTTKTFKLKSSMNSCGSIDVKLE